MKGSRDFLSEGFNIHRGFKEKPRAFFDESRTVCVRHSDGRVTEHKRITDPWKYIAKVKKVVDVVDAWIKEE